MLEAVGIIVTKESWDEESWEDGEETIEEILTDEQLQGLMHGKKLN